MLNNITQNPVSNSQEVKTAKKSNTEQRLTEYAFCGICRKPISEFGYSDHKERHRVSNRQKNSNKKSYLNRYLDRLNLTAQLKLNQSVRPRIKIPKVSRQRTISQKVDYLGRAILNTHMKLASEPYW